MSKTINLLTPARLRVLEYLKAHPEARLHYGSIGSSFCLLPRGGGWDKSIPVRADIGYALRQTLWLEEMKGEYSSYSYYYRFQPSAELTVEWHDGEAKRRRQLAENTEAEKTQRVKAEHKKAITYLNKGSIGHPFRAELEGSWAFGGIITFDGERIATISPAEVSTSDVTFDDLLKRRVNVEHFQRINRMIVAANRGLNGAK